MITQQIRAELTRLEAGIYDNSMPSDERHRMVSQYFALLKECGAPVEVRINEAGEWETRVTDDSFDFWWSEQIPGSQPFGLILQQRADERSGR